jgi:hypothetical protein
VSENSNPGKNYGTISVMQVVHAFRTKGNVLNGGTINFTTASCSTPQTYYFSSTPVSGVPQNMLMLVEKNQSTNFEVSIRIFFVYVLLPSFPYLCILFESGTLPNFRFDLAFGPTTVMVSKRP